MVSPCGRLVVASVVAASLLSSCASGDGYFDTDEPLRVAVKNTQPGLGANLSGTNFEGFEIGLARNLQQYLSENAGVDFPSLDLNGVNTADRVRVLDDGSADVLIATYSITKGRAREHDMIGPYLQTGTGILVSADDNSVHAFPDLRTKTVCTAEGENTAIPVIESVEYVSLVRGDDFVNCVDELKADRVDAVVADEIILQGFVRNDPRIKLATDATGEHPVTDGNTNFYGVAIRKGHKVSCEWIRDWLEGLYSDGTWENLFNQALNAGGSGGLDVTRYKPDPGMVAAESCTDWSGA